VALLKSFWTIWRGVRQASEVIRHIKPEVVIGFGGYPTLPPLYAATRRKVPTIVHEQNAVIGRANRALAARVAAIAGGFLSDREGAFADKIVVTGNPVRPAVLEAAKTPYRPSREDQPFRLLVFGGSQGARIFSDVVPGAVARLDEAHRGRLKLTQQCREEDIERVRSGYAAIGVEAELAPFFLDLPKRIADAHLVVSRSGASTVAELAVIGRPAILVPLPHAIDNDQLLNATALAQAKGGWLLPQSAFTPHRLAEELTARMDAPDQLVAASEAARAVGNPRAAEALADVVVALAEGRPMPAELKGASAA
jgi:UDP-N-acetylglucosamine--N-acetylmuramyl-(pentapeptide) pyrophosphoryl-undecaprenol N-acetylglucosamine transferase